MNYRPLFIILGMMTSGLQAAPDAESVIRLQVKSLDANIADSTMARGINDSSEKTWIAKTEQNLQHLMEKDKKLAMRMRNARLRMELLQTIYYEAKRAGLDPDLVFAVIRVESNFRKYAISSAGARGYMQAMKFWGSIVKENSDDLFNVRTNLRLGCAILRSYLDMEHGNLNRALGRYNGSLGRNVYPNAVYAAWN
ncbi:hypothetical protein MCAMS1_01743 [biofilm metagenome]